MEVAINIYNECVGHTSFLLHANVKETEFDLGAFMCFLSLLKRRRFTFDLEIEFCNRVLRNRPHVAANGDVAQRLLFYCSIVFVTYKNMGRFVVILCLT